MIQRFDAAKIGWKTTSEFKGYYFTHTKFWIEAVNTTCVSTSTEYGGQYRLLYWKTQNSTHPAVGPMLVALTPKSKSKYNLPRGQVDSCPFENYS